MDLSALDTSTRANAGADLHLRHPATGAHLFDEATKEPVTITLLGADSAECRRIEHAQQMRRLERARQSREQTPLDAEEVERDAVEILVALTKSWKHLILDGKPLECTHANAMMLYKRFAWIREQADKFVTARTNYLGN